VSDSTQAARKIITALADNRILPADWRFFIPIFIVQQPLPIVLNARDLAEGIDIAIEKYDIQLPEWQRATYEGSKATRYSL